MSRGPRVERAVRWYRRLWRLYPHDFRRRFEDAAMGVFADRWREETGRRGRAGVALFWMRTVGNVVLHALLERGSGLSVRALVRGARVDAVDAWRTTRRSWTRQFGPVACIALGIAATSAIVTLVTSTSLRPLPFPDAERLVRIWSVEEGVELGGRGQLSYPDLADLRGALTSLDRFVPTGRARVMFLEDDGARRVEGEAVGPGYFELLGVEPMVGRGFSADDHDPTSPPTLVLSFATWVRDYGTDPSIVGRTLRTANGGYTVVGVAPPHFVGTIEADIPDIEFWVPLEHFVTDRLRARRDAEFIWAIGRLASGASLDDTRAHLTRLGERLVGERAIDPTGGYWTEPFGENWRADVRWSNTLLLGAAALLLLVAATNVAGLLVARSIGRQRELAVRAAMGASAVRLVRRTLVETALVAIAGGVLGVLAAPWLLEAFLRLAPGRLPAYVEIGLGPRALFLSVVFVAGTALIAGVAPALASARIAPAVSLGAGGRTSTRGVSAGRSARWLVVGEVALTTVLLSTAALLVQSYRALAAVDVGYRSDGIMKLAIFIDGQDLAADAELPAFYERMRASIAEEPGVRAVGFASPTVPPGFSDEARARWTGMPESAREHGVFTNVHPVDPAFTTVLDIELLAGRTIEASDDDRAEPVAVVSASLAETMGGATEAIGRALDLSGREHRVVGVVEDVMYLGAAFPRPREVDVYVPLAQDPSRIVSMAILTDGDPEALVPGVRARLARLAPRSPLDWVASMRTDLTRGFDAPRFYTLLLLAFAAAALLLTAAGVFAILAHKVAGERTEMGIRRAFGASRASLLFGVVRSGVSLCALGLGLGAIGAAWVGRLLGDTLFGVGWFEPKGALVAAAVVLATGAIASLTPAWRATRTSPMDAMRDV